VEDADRKTGIFKVVKLLAIVIFVVSPLFYLGVALLLEISPSEVNNIDLILYLLLFISVFLPTLTIPIKRSFISKANMSPMTGGKRAPLFITMFIVISALIEAIYVFGIVVYFLSGDIQRMLYFYPIGIAWTFMHWPSREKFDAFVNPPGKP
jgi:hypothetical protein